MTSLDKFETQDAQDARTKVVSPGAEVGTPKGRRGLWTKSGILGRSYIARRPVIGVYFLIYKDEIVYVGKSVDILERIRTHLRGRMGGWHMKFTHYSIHACHKLVMTELERAYIDEFMPRYNMDLTTQNRRKAARTMESPLGTDWLANACYLRSLSPDCFHDHFGNGSVYLVVRFAKCNVAIRQGPLGYSSGLLYLIIESTLAVGCALRLR